jgi:hypothetical protein
LLKLLLKLIIVGYNSNNYFLITHAHEEKNPITYKLHHLRNKNGKSQKLIFEIMFQNIPLENLKSIEKFKIYAKTFIFPLPREKDN